jgi:hypothetical protein
MLKQGVGQMRRVRLQSNIFWSALIIVTMVGCGRTFRGKTNQLNPLAAPLETRRTSERITIVTGDMELRAPRSPKGAEQIAIYRTDRYPLINQASFSVVSKDRLRFHVQVDHKWQEWVDLREWRSELVDDQGHSYTADSVERADTKLMVTMWDTERRTAVKNGYGDIVAINNDGWKQRQTLGSLNVYRGRADLVFHKPEIFRPDIKWLRLRISRTGLAFEFTWNFEQLAEYAPAEATESH